MRTRRSCIAIGLACVVLAAAVTPAAALSVEGLIGARAAAVGAPLPPAPKALGALGAAGAFAVDPFEPDDATETAKPLAPGVTASHTFWYPSLQYPYNMDVDVHSIDVVAGRTYLVHGWPTDGATSVSSLRLPSDYALSYPSYDRANWSDSVGSSETVQCWTAEKTETVYVAFLDIRSRYSRYYSFGYPPSFGGSYDVRLEDLGVVDAGTVGRLAGADRYAIAAELAKNTSGDYAGVTSAIIVSGLDAAMADSLSAAGLAGVLDAPVLLARGDKPYLPAATAAALSAMAAQNPGTPLEVHIIGGYGSVPPALERRIRQAAPGCTLQRLSGADRYAVSANVARHMRSHEPTDAPALAFVVNGQVAWLFTYGLAASPVAASTHAPILLVKSGSVPLSVRALLNGYGERVYVGPVLPLSALAPYTKPTDTKLTGGTSYYDYVFSRGPVYDLADIAEQRGWLEGGEYTLAGRLPDALTAGTSPLTRNRAMLFASMPWPYNYYSMTSGAFDFLQVRRADSPDVLIVGGTSSVTPAVEDRVREAVGQIP